MNKLILASAAALALAVPAAAQDMAVTTTGDVYVLTDAQRTTYDAWPAERRSDYDAWPNDYRSYYWTLTEPQQQGWWLLTPEQRAQLYTMAPDARTTAWTAIEGQMASTLPADASPAAQAATGGAVVAGEPRFVSGEVLQTTPASTRASGEYPVCSSTVTDSCVNPREAGKNYGNRPLNYWPGRPASEIPGQKAQK